MGKTFQLFGTEVQFPYEPYAVQYALMEKILRACEGGCNALLESPTGSGKSLSLLCSVLAWQNKLKQKLKQKQILREENGRERFSIQSQETLNATSVIQQDKQISFSETEQEGSVPQLANKRLSSTSDDDFQEPLRFRPNYDRPIAEICSSQSGDNTLDEEDHSNESDTVTHIPTIFFATRTHSQLGQVVQELHRTSYRPKMDILASRNHYCIQKKVAASQNKNEECKKLLEERLCSYAFGVEKVHRTKELSKVWDIEDLVKVGRRHNMCPYFASQELMKDAELIFCPYSYLLDPVVRNAMQVNLHDSIIILDEAHNIEDICRETASCEVSVEDLEQARTELEQLQSSPTVAGSMREHLSLISSFILGITSWCHEQDINDNFSTDKNDFERETCSFTGEALIEALDSCGVNSSNYIVLRTSFKKISNSELYIQTETERGKRSTLSSWASILLESIFNVLEFIFGSEVEHSNDYLLILMKTRKSTSWSIRLCLWCLDPAVSFSFLKQHSRCIILTSGTLTPMDSFSSELGIHFDIVHSFPHVIDVKSQVCAIASSYGPNKTEYDSTFMASNSIAYHDALGEALIDYCRVIPDGLLCFFPSYRLLESVTRRWHQSGCWKEIETQKQIFTEPTSYERINFDSVLLSYYQAVRSSQGALLLAVCRGKVSEGMDFKDKYARGVIVIGIPYPNLRDPQVIQKKKYNDTYSAKKKLLSGQRWYTLQAFRALNQAIGRCIRHRHDYGVIILLDKRYGRNDVQTNLPKWLFSQVRTGISHQESVSLLEAFMKYHQEAEHLLLKGSNKRVISPPKRGTTGRREGNRGGRDQFSWEQVKEDKYRENYLGHSLHAPVGLSAKNKDFNWFVKPKQKTNTSAPNEELVRIQKQEEIMRQAILQGLSTQDAVSLAIQKLEKEQEVATTGQEQKQEKDEKAELEQPKDIPEEEKRSHHHHHRRHHGRDSSRRKDREHIGDRRHRIEKRTHSHRSHPSSRRHRQGKVSDDTARVEKCRYR
eukprot:jgi/Galph1/1769/GphlegSOOS_G436.1